MKAKVIVLNKKFDGIPNEDNFKLIEEDIPHLMEGEFLVKAEYLSVDPYMRIFTKVVGKPIMGEQVAEIIESKNDKFPVGEYVVAELGWRTLTVCEEIPGNFLGLPPRLISDFFGDLPRSLALGILGMPGITAQFGFINGCRPKLGNVVVISGAAGAVGTTVGQLAKNSHCVVIGITGSDNKGRRLTAELKFDAYLNYKNGDFPEQLTKFTPKGVDCYFDNVGGDISYYVLNRMNQGGRVLVCGSISKYSERQKSGAKDSHTLIKSKQLTVQNFCVTNWREHWDEGIQKNLNLVLHGKLKRCETITEGFENMPKAFIGMLQGENFGKAIVKV